MPVFERCFIRFKRKILAAGVKDHKRNFSDFSNTNKMLEKKVQKDSLDATHKSFVSKDQYFVA